MARSPQFYRLLLQRCQRSVDTQQLYYKPPGLSTVHTIMLIFYINIINKANLVNNKALKCNLYKLKTFCSQSTDLQALSLIITFNTHRDVHDLWRSILDALVYILVSATFICQEVT